MAQEHYAQEADSSKNHQVYQVYEALPYDAAAT